MWLQIVAEAFFWLFAIMGVCDLLYRISAFFFMYGKTKIQDISVVVTIKGKEEKAEWVLRSLQRNLEGMSTRRGQPDIYVCDAGMDDDTKQTIVALCDSRDNLFLCHKTEIMKEIDKKTTVL